MRNQNGKYETGSETKTAKTKLKCDKETGQHETGLQKSNGKEETGMQNRTEITKSEFKPETRNTNQECET